ncbi:MULTISPECIES: hypothetical protein [Leptospira]|uniref:DUF7660 domain-containing protein n=2 Tax=Leptospira borgpetersenii TaxID=174 RepID=A0A0E3B982_LEPBO|nr:MULTISPECIES: hypothetical protein [Leptospira]EMO09401.1 hypothetical protein LEP1GSC137_2021 [Leptospira borgpetersenii str. Noumea 25]ALO24981.1 hypothetical protein LBBP_00641 [Leptospira borgpetersenii serovar Ballum]ANH00008.1 Uncharacterized protein LB4E_0517 [Leptospira borgpetersenii str. 4E]AXX15462.1 hypothetical protein C4Q31_07815 [Leptospira borgpetersenii serovar Ceylonica]EMK11507.1 hypothetical protein LEP1GSC066_1753 [Leptospira sp. serovar Kenya str. Sh9]
MERKNVKSKKEFKLFLMELIEDYRQNKEMWECCDIETFLENILVYSEDIIGFYRNSNLDLNPEIASWQLFADILCGARIYE